MVRYIFVTGGVVSSLGKGIASAALGALLQARGYSVRLRKFDPYLNVDPGTMSPCQHGEVFVTDDGAEADLDLGHYERFTGSPAHRSDNITAGYLYRDIIAAERRGDYLGKTVQIIPHVTDAIKKLIIVGSDGIDFILCEIGGTVGDIEGLPFFEAIRQLGNELPDGQVVYIHLTLLPFIPSAGELKTKPTQHSVKELLSIGIRPNILLCRCDRMIPDNERRKIALFCNVRESAVVEARDVDNIYDVPIVYHKNGLDTEVLSAFGIINDAEPDLAAWHNVSDCINNPEGSVRIVVVGKYTSLPDAYKSLQEALVHGGIVNRVRVNLEWINVDCLEEQSADITRIFDGVHGILVPGGFGERGTKGKIAAVNFARTQNIPYFGICLGMQMAIIEFARNVLGISGAGSTEFGSVEDPVVGLMTEWVRGDELERRSEDSNLGGTMRLGAYETHLSADSKVAVIYGRDKIFERHRHRYEVNVHYREKFEQAGLLFSGMSPDELLPEIIELMDHPWFIGVQYHPEFKSKPLDPHPLFSSFVAAAVKCSRIV